MASFDATSSAVPDSLLLARQADRLARQATNTVMQDTISRPALGDSSNTLSVEAMVKQGGRAKAPRRICHGCVALRNEGEALKREVLRLRSGMKAMQARLEALQGDLRGKEYTLDAAGMLCLSTRCSPTGALLRSEAAAALAAAA